MKGTHNQTKKINNKCVLCNMLSLCSNERKQNCHSFALLSDLVSVVLRPEMTAGSWMSAARWHCCLPHRSGWDRDHYAGLQDDSLYSQRHTEIGWHEQRQVGVPANFTLSNTCAASLIPLMFWCKTATKVTQIKYFATLSAKHRNRVILHQCTFSIFKTNEADFQEWVEKQNNKADFSE